MPAALLILLTVWRVWRSTSAAMPAPKAAVPTATPTCRNVELMPDAMPARRTSTTLTAVDASGGFVMPMPMPQSTKPGSNTVHSESPFTARSVSTPAPTNVSPSPISSPGEMRAESRPTKTRLRPTWSATAPQVSRSAARPRA